MDIAIFGATRGSGRQLAELALEQGHTVTALVRTPARFELSHARLRVVQGDVTDYAAVAGVVRGQDAVFCALGAPALKATNVREVGTRNIVEAMREHGVERLVSLSALGVRESRAQVPLWVKYLLIPLYLRRAYADHARQEEAIEDSALQWTIVRPPFLTDGERTGVYAHGFSEAKGLQMKISRADVADFMLAQLHDNRYVGRMPAISY